MTQEEINNWVDEVCAASKYHRRYIWNHRSASKKSILDYEREYMFSDKVDMPPGNKPLKLLIDYVRRGTI